MAKFAAKRRNLYQELVAEPCFLFDYIHRAFVSTEKERQQLADVNIKLQMGLPDGSSIDFDTIRKIERPNERGNRIEIVLSIKTIEDQAENRIFSYDGDIDFGDTFWFCPENHHYLSDSLVSLFEIGDRWR